MGRFHDPENARESAWPAAFDESKPKTINTGISVPEAPDNGKADPRSDPRIGQEVRGEGLK